MRLTMLRTMLVLWGIVILVALALTALGGCDLSPVPEPDFAQVRIYNDSDSTVAVDTDAKGWRLSPGDSVDATFTTYGLQRVTVIGPNHDGSSDTVDAYFDVTNKAERSFLRVR